MIPVTYVYARISKLDRDERNLDPVKATAWIHRVPLGQKPAITKPPTRLQPPEPADDVLMHPFYAIGPPGHFRHLVSPSVHHLTSSPVNRPNSTCS